MADLVSPGVQVTIIDQSQYLPAAQNSVPFVLIATQQDKANPNGTGVAQGTTAANAGKLYRVTSQRDLVSLFGNPYFQTDSSGNPIQGGELNEYGLLAAYYALGATNSAYILRADVDLAELQGSAGRPVGAPANGTWWQDVSSSTWGIYEWNATTQTFNLQDPIVITNPSLISNNAPLSSIGNVGDYAVVIASQDDGTPVQGPQTYAPPWEAEAKQFFLKTVDNVWVPLGAEQWLNSVPTVVGTNSNPVLVAGNTFTLSLGNNQNITITVPAAPNNTVGGIVNIINTLGWAGLGAAQNAAGRLELFCTIMPHNQSNAITVLEGTGTVLVDLGIPAGKYYQPHVRYGTSAQQPLWQTGQAFPNPTGAVWIKVGSQGNGLVPAVSQYSSTVADWVPKNVALSISDWAATAALDSTGGQAIPANTVYAQYNWNNSPSTSGEGPVYLWKRLATGPTVVTGTNTNPQFNAGPYAALVYISVPGSSLLSNGYGINLADNTDATDFVEAWQLANIPYTTASVSPSGAIVLTHTEGGVILINDAGNGTSNGLLATAGFVPNVTTGVKYSVNSSPTFTNVLQSGTTGVGTGLTLNVTPIDARYIFSIVAGGSNYAVGDLVTFPGTSIGGSSPANDLVLYITEVNAGVVSGATLLSGNCNIAWFTQLSNWVKFTYDANEGAPVATPANDTYWYYSAVDQVDIMINYGGAWKGYLNQGYDSNGFPSPSAIAGLTDPNGPIISSSAPETQSDGTPLVYGDLWIDTSDLENYPLVNRWQSVNGSDQWVLLDNTNQTSPNGILFADARWATNGTTNPADDPIPSIVSLLSSNYLDLDAPEQSLYPVGMLLFNTRRSGYNVKAWKTNYLSASNFPDQGPYPAEKSTWVTQSGNKANGAPYMGRQAQRALVVSALRASLVSNQSVRDEDNYFNLMACPNYVELTQTMGQVNAERDFTAYIIGDTPMGLPTDATAIAAWAQAGSSNVLQSGDDGLVFRSQYMALFYPSGLSSDLNGNLVAVPPSHMMLSTFLRNDAIAYPWLAAAGTRRGLIDNATNIGYVDRTTGEFIPTKTNLGIRDTLYENNINPLVFFTGSGLLNYGNKSCFAQSGSLSTSALDRTNVARLVAYIRRQLTIAARPFVFEPNDATTRKEIAGVVESLMLDLIAKRGIYDYLVVCDESNNTPERIDRNELWIDVAIEPVKAAEFIYIPVRILNTGELGGTNTQAGQL